MRGSKLWSAVVAIGLVGWATSAANAATITVESISAWNGVNSIGQFGEFNTATYGQVVTVPAGMTYLDGFTFLLDDLQNTDFVDFAAYVWAWDGIKATGPILYQSGPMSSSNNGGAGGFESFAVSTGGVSVTPGNAYVLAFSASNYFDGTAGTSIWATVNNNAAAPDTIPGGNFVFMNNSNNLSQLTTNSWSQRAGDLAFSATFSDSVVPEPSTAVLLGLGLGGVSLRRRGSARLTA